MQRQIKQTAKETTTLESTLCCMSYYECVCEIDPISRHRCEEHSQKLQSTQQSVSMELGEKQSLCQQLRSTVDTMTAQLAQAEETKKQVS